MDEMTGKQEKGMEILMDIFGSLAEAKDTKVILKGLDKWVLKTRDLKFRAMLILAIREKIHGRELARVLNVPRSRASKLLNEWIQDGVIEKVGEKGGYRISDPDIFATFSHLGKQISLNVDQ
jgi:predicted XRE-type DNA-binding protein